MKKTILFGMITAMGLASCSEEDGLMQGMSGMPSFLLLRWLLVLQTRVLSVMT